jgi:hypothetical protein
MSRFTQAFRLGLAFASTSALGRRSRIVIVFDVTLSLYHTWPKPANSLAASDRHPARRNADIGQPGPYGEVPSYLPSNSPTITRSSFSSLTLAVILPRLNSLIGTP